MKLRNDGTLEGTPEEITEYMRLKDPMFGKMSLPLTTTGVYEGSYPGCDGNFTRAMRSLDKIYDSITEHKAR